MKRSPLFSTLRLCAAAALTYHALAIAVSGLVPEEGPFAARVRPMFHAYLRATGNMNDWAMFTDRPAFARFAVKAIAQLEDGTTRHYGPLLPGLEPYDGSMRALKLFVRLGQPSENEAAALYFAALRRAIEKREGKTVRELALDYDVDLFTNPTGFGKSKKLVERRTFRRGS